MDDQFDVEIVVYKDETKDEYYARLNITLDAKTIEQALIKAVDLLETKHICKYYMIVKVRNNSVA